MRILKMLLSKTGTIEKGKLLYGVNVSCRHIQVLYKIYTTPNKTETKFDRW